MTITGASKATVTRDLQDLADKGIVVPAGADAVSITRSICRTIQPPNAKGLVLPRTDSNNSIFLACRVGYATNDWQAGARHLQTDIEEHMGTTREFWEDVWGVVIDTFIPNK